MYRDLNQKLASDLSNLLSAKAFWYITSMFAAATLQVAPIAFPEAWKGDTKQAINFSATAACLAIGAATSGKVQRQVTETRINNFVGHQLEIDESVAVINLERAKVMNAIRLLNGVRTQGELQEMMNQGIAMMQMGAAQMQAIEGSETAGALPSSSLATEDLAQSLATATNSGTLIIAPSGCGKTSLLRNAIVAANTHYNTNVDFQVVDCKGEDYWCGLESSPNDYTLLDDDRARDGFAALQLIKGRLSAVNPQFPTIAIIDEWNNGVASLVNSPEISREEKQQAVSATRQIVTKGRSKQVFGWLTTHTPKTDQIGMDASTRQSLNVIILGRGNKIGLIGAILKGGKFDFVDDDNQRESLLQQYQIYVKSPQFDSRIPIALTNLDGDWRLIQLPHYPEKPQAIGKSVLNSPASDVEFVRSGDDDPERSTLAMPDLSLANDCAKYISGAIPKYGVNGEWLELRILQQNWAKNRGLNSKELGVLLRKMYELGWIKVNPQNNKQIALADAD